MAVNLVFSRPRLAGAPTHLIFGEDQAPPAPVTVAISATLANTLVVSASVAVPVQAKVAARLSGSVSVTMVSAYDSRVTRWLGQPVESRHQVATIKSPRMLVPWKTAVSKTPTAETGWQDGQKAKLELSSGVDVAETRALELSSVVEVAHSHPRRYFKSVHQAAVQQFLPVLSDFQDSAPLVFNYGAKIQSGVGVIYLPKSPWGLGTSLPRRIQSPAGASLYWIGKQFVAVPWDSGMPPPSGRVAPVVPIGPRYPRDGHLVFECPRITGSPTHLVFGPSACYFPTRARVVVPVKRIYMVLNEVSLRRVDGNIALPTTGMTLTLDADSWAWGFGASLPGSVLADLEPDSFGAPVELEALVNGTAFRVLVEGISRERTFGQSNIRVSGRGKTALLDGPYAPVRNFGNASGARTAQQLMADVLTVNGVALDWALDWQLEDWLVPAGVFAHQGSYISALNAIAAAAGGYIQPHAALQTIRVLPRYPSAPWHWPALEQAGTLVPDFELPAAVTTREGIEWVERARYNRVYISGQQGGRLGQVTRTGTAGDLLAPMLVDALITDAIAARQRGISVLGNTGRQANITLGLPVLPETGVILPGSMVRYVDAGVSRLGIARGVSLSVGFPEVWQSIGVETHV